MILLWEIRRILSETLGLTEVSPEIDLVKIDNQIENPLKPEAFNFKVQKLNFV